jgi:hypothetical protein
MIISLKHNYIYVRTRKTGSSTIEWWLRQHLGPDDIVVKSSLECLWPVLRPGADVPDASGLITHVAAAQVMPLIREDLWNSAFKFTSERHPYEKAVSFAYFRLDQMKKSGKHERLEREAQDFESFLDRVVRGGLYTSFSHYSVDGKPVVDDFIRLESLVPDLQRIAARIGIPAPEELPRKRGKSRTDQRPATEILTQEQKEIVWDFCRPEFELLGYQR